MSLYIPGIRDFILDYESLGLAPDGAVVDLAVIAFDNDAYNPPTFKQLVDSALHVKFDRDSQKGVRVFDPGVIQWWKTQEEAALKLLAKSDRDVLIPDGMEMVVKYLKDNKVDQWKSHGFCRGMSFDFAIAEDMIRKHYGTRDTFKVDWCKFWNQRDIRTAIEYTLMTRGMTECPLPKGTLDGFVRHNSIHDCAKDVLMLIYAQRYALGLEDCPSEEDADPNSLKKTR